MGKFLKMGLRVDLQGLRLGKNGFDTTVAETRKQADNVQT